jgi:CHAT domain-containing protein
VQLERARRGLRPDDLPRALAAADRARHLDPSLKEAWFNRAATFSMLSLRTEARSAWVEYLKRDGVSPWAAEAKSRLDELEKPSAAEAWPATARELDQSIDATAAETAVRSQTTEARNYVETLFGRWADAVTAGSSGNQELARLQTMAVAFRRVTGDALYSDTAAVIDRATAAGNTAELARAHEQLRDAVMIFREDRYADALPGLTRAQELLLTARSPLAIRAALDIATIDYLQNRYVKAGEELEATLTVARQRGYGGSVARAHWLKALIAFAQGRMADAQSGYEDALAEYERMGDAEQVAAAHNGLATLYFYIGDEGRAWEHHPLALKALQISSSPRLLMPTLASAATSARFSNPAAALAIQEEAVAVAIAWGRPAAIAEALALRAALRADAGQSDLAKADLAGARQQLAKSTDAALRERVEVAVLTTESDLQRSTNPRAAVAAATRALAIVEGRGDRSRLASLNLRLAKANIALGRADAAQHALEQGIKAFEAERAATSNEARALITDASWDLFTTSVHLAIKRGDLDGAFAMAERSRLRSIAEPRRLPSSRTLSEIQSSLSDTEAIVALNQFDSELAVWIIRSTGTRALLRPLSRVDAGLLVSRQQNEIWQQSVRASGSRDLYNEILRPARQMLSGVSKIVFVPDATYENVAFSTLWDSTTQRFLIENVLVSTAPSANAYVAVRNAGHSGSSDLLVFGGGPPRAIDEANAIANAAPTASLVSGDGATRSRLFAGIAGHSLVHIAAPVSVSGQNPLLSRLQVADEPGTRHSGTIRGTDIAAQTLSQTRLVVMDEVPRDASYRGEGTLSVARAFITAGVPAVVGTLPGADENATRDLMIAFHREMSQGVSAEQALQTVQRNAIQQNGRRLGAWSALVLYGSDR